MSAEQLKSQFIEMRSRGLSGGSAFFDDLRRHPNDYAVTQFCLWLLYSMTEANTILEAMRAALEIAYRQQTYILPQLKAVRLTLPARRGGFRDYRMEVDKAITVLEKAREHRLCKCEIVSEFDHAPEAHDFINISNVAQIDLYEKTITCDCCICNRHWHVTYIDHYHYPTYRWRVHSSNS